MRHNADEVHGDAQTLVGAAKRMAKLMKANTNRQTARPRSPSSARGQFVDDLRTSLLDAAVALVLAGVAFAILVARLHRGVNAAAIEMPQMVRNGGVWAYSISQALGWSALAWSWLTVMLGLALPILSRRSPSWRRSVERLHRSTSLSLLALMLGHALALLWDRMGDTIVGLFVPYATSYVPGRFAQTLGILSLYLALILGPTFYFRDRLGRATWRAVHRYLVPAVYILAVWHTLAYGSDIKGHNALWTVVWLMQAPISILFIARLRSRSPLPTGR